MPVSILDIVNLPELHTRFLGGYHGGERQVSWAHVCELPDPTEWLGEGDLLMTTGIGIPLDPDQQRKYIEVLAQAGLAGVMIGEDMQAPPDLEALQSAADDLGFPVLLTWRGVPFSSVTRAIIDASRKEEFERRNAITRLCGSARAAIEGLGLRQLLERLEHDIHAKLALLDIQTLQPWAQRQVVVSEDLRAALHGQLADFREGHSIVRRFVQPNGEVFAIPVPSRINCLLLVSSAEGNVLDYSLLHHLVAVLGIALERLHVEAERMLRLGSELIDDLLSDRLTPYEAKKKLGSFSIPIEAARIAVTRIGKESLTDVMVNFQRMGTTALIRSHADELIMVFNFDSLPTVRALLKDGVGFSNPIRSSERLSDALREARLALSHAVIDRVVVSYAEIANKVPWLPKSLDEAALTFQRVLKSVSDYDSEQGASLLHSLRVFLEENRSWLSAARRLCIHKTTLIYRIRRIESLTGRSLDKTEDVVIFWMALQAGEVSGLYVSRDCGRKIAEGKRQN